MFTPGVADAARRSDPTSATPRTSSRCRRPPTAATTSPSRWPSTTPPTPGTSRRARGRARPTRRCRPPQSTNAQGQVVGTGQVTAHGAALRAVPGPGADAAVVQPGRCLRPGVEGRPDPDHVRLHRGRVRPGHYGKLTVFQTPRHRRPALVDADISATQAISPQISLLNQNGSSVQLGTLQVVPVGDSMLYFRPFYVESARNPFPKLDYYIVVYSGPTGQSKVAFDTTLPAGTPGPVPRCRCPVRAHPTADTAARGPVHRRRPARPEPDRPGQHGLPTGPDRPEGRQLRRLRHRHHQPPERAPAAPAGLRQPSNSASGASPSTSTTTTTTTTSSSWCGGRARARQSSRQPSAAIGAGH